MPRRRLLAITYHHPPDTSGGHRWALMGKWLRRLGHEVVTVTSAAHGGLADDQATGTQRVGDLASSPTLRRLLGRPAVASSEPVTASPSRIFTDVIVPDANLATWAPGALRVARRLIRERDFDCLLTSGPPHSTHLIGLMLGSSRPAWIADFRDGWRYEPLRPPWPTPLQERLDGALERRVVTAAEAVIGVTRPIAEDFRDRLGVRSAYIANGWDPDWLEGGLDGDAPELAPDTVNIVHTGTLGSGAWRDPAPLFAALSRLAAEDPGGARRPRLVLAGQLDAESERLIEGVGGDLVQHLGRIPRERALALQRQSDALLLLTSSRHVSHATGKLFEYLAAGTPIIALAKGNEAARIVEETATGVTVAPDDVEGICRAIRSAMDGSLARGYAPRDLDRYVYPGPAEAVAELIEQAIARRLPARRPRA
jgi:glycosyltransferase involved in cell wall biosynthesis